MIKPKFNIMEAVILNFTFDYNIESVKFKFTQPVNAIISGMDVLEEESQFGTKYLMRYRLLSENNEYLGYFMEDDIKRKDRPTKDDI